MPTGIAMALPEGYARFVQPRSGLALKHGVTCLNTPGLIDSGYRGELKVLLLNTEGDVDPAKFEKLDVELIDDLETVPATVQKQKALCAPADVGGEGQERICAGTILLHGEATRLQCWHVVLSLFGEELFTLETELVEYGSQQQAIGGERMSAAVEAGFDAVF